MNPVTQLPRHPRRRGFLNDDASLETASRPIHLLRIDASPRASKSNSMPLTDALVTAYTDALPSVTVDVMNVWDEKLPEFDNAASMPGTRASPAAVARRTPPLNFRSDGRRSHRPVASPPGQSPIDGPARQQNS
jgi:hypothetical protein